ncbi:retrovirus-related Pol polyprotein from transposon 412 [Trichonephila clavipes]|nr:retrovirus-related Pol polyprotein from transposon 412 [Trichonephila clavipes]
MNPKLLRLNVRTKRSATSSAGDAEELDTREETVPDQGRMRTPSLLPNRKINIWPFPKNRKFCFGLIDYPDSDNSNGGVMIVLSVVDLSKSVIPVRVANISDKTRIIQEGEVIAACAPGTCVDRKCNSQDLSSENLVKDLLHNKDRREIEIQEGRLKNFKAYFQEAEGL